MWANGRERPTRTDKDGAFEFRGAVPNSYEVLCEVQGFKQQRTPINAAQGDVDIGTVILDIAPIEDPVLCYG